MNDAFLELSRAGIPVMAISGNHDSSDRLAFGSELLQLGGVHLHTSLHQNREPVVLEDEHGPVSFHLIPYIEPAEARAAFDKKITTHDEAYRAIVEDIEERFDMNERHVLIGHAFIQGGMESDSEERLTMLGGTPYIDAELLRPFTYVALGHLHQPQQVGHPHIRYSGSPLKYSFSEVNHRKSVTVVQIEEDVSIESRPLVPRKDLEIVEGFFTELMKGHAADRVENYLNIRLLDEGEILDPVGQLRTIYPNILHLERKSTSGVFIEEEVAKVREKRNKSPLEVVEDYYQLVKEEELTEGKKRVIQEVLEEVRTSEKER
ncbi:exonuclease SbcCD subunit D C-terminal domain-containing protein [Salimicrobium sp. PL1-032A]|uniref:exonuclease SbcCD subunit D n=1 Tax=Salimicrobium sp. PL1-032A TaxID=3095364 RepID=UPI0032617C80